MKKEMFDDSEYTTANHNILSSTVVNCPKCDKALSYTVRVKLLYPPLKVMACKFCKLLYSKE